MHNLSNTMSHHSYRVTNNHSVSQSDGSKNIKVWLLWPCTSSNSDPHLQGCYYTMTSVYHTNYHYPALLYSLMTSDQRVGKTHLKIKMWVHWTSCIPLGQHPIIALQPLILLHTQWPVLPAWFQFFICITPWIITIRISKNIKEQIYIH